MFLVIGYEALIHFQKWLEETEHEVYNEPGMHIMSDPILGIRGVNLEVMVDENYCPNTQWCQNPYYRMVDRAEAGSGQNRLQKSGK